IDKYVVMPNHIHIIIFLYGGKSRLDNIIGSYKSFVSRRIHKQQPALKVWQESFHDHIVRNEKSYQNIWLYIESNPMNWEKDCFYLNNE
ncbi:MAG: transposase, partial [Oscillospiraceae bacterium]|nr:transposase [Oscillospiraceae bacterium]